MSLSPPAFPLARTDIIEGPATPSRHIAKPKKKDFIRIFNRERGMSIRLKGRNTPVIPEELSGTGANGKTCWICGPPGGPGNIATHTRFRPKTVCLECSSPFLCTTRHYEKCNDSRIRLSSTSCFDYFHSTPVIRKSRLMNRKLAVRNRTDGTDDMVMTDGRMCGEEHSRQRERETNTADRTDKVNVEEHQTTSGVRRRLQFKCKVTKEINMTAMRCVRTPPPQA